jgi:glycosyltransferase involved in cell wall biosynthesis
MIRAGDINAAWPQVTILLSTYNGARFLAAQLNSLLAQTHENWVLYWRDDGSTDDSVRIMHDFALKAGAARCVESPSSGVHFGASPSFFLLLEESLGAEAVAFADQDDVWLPEKLSSALELLAGAGAAPALYCARQYRVDEALSDAALSATYRKVPDFPACLTQNIANGNTLVMNAAAAALVACTGLPEDAVHDWWSYIVVSACGGLVLFDERPQVLYRLHESNLIGKAHPLFHRALAALRRGPCVYMTMMQRHADALAAQASLLSPAARRDLRLVQAALQGGVLHRAAALCCPRFRRRTLLENLLFGYWFITNTRSEANVRPAWSAPKAPAKQTRIF